MKRMFICWAMLLAVCINASAQDAKKDLGSINKAYKNTGRLSMTLEYAVYLDGSKVPYEKESGLYRKDGENLYMKQMETEIMCNDKNVTIVNHDSKLVMMDKVQKQEMFPWEEVLDSVLPLYKSVKYYVPEGTSGLKAYSFYFHGTEYERVDIWFNASTFLVEKIQARYARPVEENGNSYKVMLELNFRDIDTKSKYPAAMFSPEAYVAYEKGKYSLKPAYKNYRFINHLIAGK